MKKIALFILGLAATESLFSFRISDPVILRLNLTEGATYKYNTTISQKISTMVAGQSYNSDMNMASSIDMKVKKKYGQDSMLLETKYSHMSMSVSSMGHNTSFDSDNPGGDQGNEMGKLYSVMSSHPVAITTDAWGKIIRIDGITQLSRSMDSSLQGDNPAMKKVMESLFNEQSYKQALTNLNMFQNKPVNMGDKWNQVITLTSIVPMKINLTYTVKQINPSSVVLNVAGEIKSTADSADISGMTIPVHVTGTQTGTYTVDRATGLISTGNVDQNIQTKMSMMGQDMNVTTQGNTIITEKEK